MPRLSQRVSLNSAFFLVVFLAQQNDKKIDPFVCPVRLLLRCHFSLINLKHLFFLFELFFFFSSSVALFSRYISENVFSCHQGIGGKCNSFYRGCVDCNADAFNANLYSPWGVGDAQTYCLSLSSNSAVTTVSQVFAPGPCLDEPTLWKNNPMQGAHGLTACLVCPVGKRSNAALDRCVDCTVGMYQSSTGQNICLECQAGTFALVPGTSTCDTCPAGKYHDQLETTVVSSISKWTTTGTKNSLEKPQANIWKDMIEMRDFGSNTNQGIVWTDVLSSTVRNACFNLRVTSQEYSYFGWTNRVDVVNHVSQGGSNLSPTVQGSTHAWYISGTPTQVRAHESGASQAQTSVDPFTLNGKYISLCREIESIGGVETGVFTFYAGNMMHPYKYKHLNTLQHTFTTTQSPYDQNIRPFIASKDNHAEKYSNVHMTLSHPACKSCQAGSYSSASSATKCTVCEAGKYHAANTLNAVSCLSCPPGTANHWPQVSGKEHHDNLDDCEICQSATYTNTTGARWCKKCSFGKRMPTVVTTGNHNEETDCAPEEYIYMCKHKIHAGPEKNEQVSRYCGQQFETSNFDAPWDGDYWLNQRNLPEGTYPPRLTSVDADYDVDPAKECGKRCRRAYPTDSSEPWTNEGDNRLWRISVRDNHLYSTGCAVQHGTSCIAKRAFTFYQPAGITVYQEGGVSGTLVYALTGFPTKDIYIRANVGSPSFSRSKGLLFGNCALRHQRPTSQPPLSLATYVKQEGTTAFNNLWYEKSCYIPPTQHYIRNGYYNYYGLTSIISATNLDNGADQTPHGGRIHHGRMTANSFVVSKSTWTFSVASSTINAPKGTIVRQRAMTKDGGIRMNRATGTLVSALGASVTSIVVVADAGSVPFHTAEDLIVGDTTILSSAVHSATVSGGRCRCAEKPINNGNGKKTDGYWSYYYDRSAVQQHPIQVGDTLELTVDRGGINGAKSEFVTVLTADKYFFTFQNPKHLCLKTMSEWLAQRGEALKISGAATDSTLFAPPMSKWFEYLSDKFTPLGMYNLVKGHSHGFLVPVSKYPRLPSEATTFESEYENYFKSAIYKSSVTTLSIKERNFEHCLMVPRHYTIRRLAGNTDVWYKKDGVSVKEESERMATGVPVPDTRGALNAKQKGFYHKSK